VIYRWNKTSEELKETPLFRWRDFITKDYLGIPQDDWSQVINQTVAHIKSWQVGSVSDVDELPGKLYALLAPMTLPQLPDNSDKLNHHHFCLLPGYNHPGAMLADYALTCSAIAYCLAYDNGYRDDISQLQRLRLSAMTSEMSEHCRDVYDAIWDLTSITPIIPNIEGNKLERILYLVQLAAASRMLVKNGKWTNIRPDSEDFQTLENAISTVDNKRLFEQHDLVKMPDIQSRIGLVLGGAIEPEKYFLESANLLEIRGANMLMSRIYQEDIPALFGRKLNDEERVHRIREEFRISTGVQLNVPECVIGADDRGILAYAPASMAHEVAQEIEKIYIREAMVGNSVAVSETFELLELQYGIAPRRFWVEDYLKGLSDNTARTLLEIYYGKAQRGDTTDKMDGRGLKSKISASSQDSLKQQNLFFKKKCFGELMTKLDSEKSRRCEGNPTGNRKNPIVYPPNIETIAYARSCSSCGLRPAVVEEPTASEEFLCEACALKRSTGKSKGIKNWTSAFEAFLQEHGLADEYFGRAKDNKAIKTCTIENLDAVIDFTQIASFSAENAASEFIGILYAGGNNINVMLKEMETPTSYRQFSNRIYAAMQDSTFEAIAQNLHPIWCEGLAATPDPTWIHPFEIVQLNGDGLFLIIPGNKAIQMAFQILRQFEQRFSSHRYHDGDTQTMQRYQNVNLLGIIANQQPALSLAAGLVIADKQVPIHFLEELTAKLLKSAKRKAQALNSQWGYQGSVVDILTLKSLSMVNSDLDNSRKTARNEKLTMRPYTLYELGGLIRTVQKLKEAGIPRAQIFQRREQLHSGKNTSALDYLHFRNSLRGEQIRVLREEIELTWCSNSDGQTLPPWRKVFETDLQRQRRLEKGKGDYQPYETILLDIIDMYDFI